MDTIDHLSRATIDAVVTRARVARLSPVLIAVLIDPTQPDVARLRAFGRLTAALGVAGQRPAAAVRPAA